MPINQMYQDFLYTTFDYGLQQKEEDGEPVSPDVYDYDGSRWAQIQADADGKFAEDAAKFHQGGETEEVIRYNSTIETGKTTIPSKRAGKVTKRVRYKEPHYKMKVKIIVPRAPNGHYIAGARIRVERTALKNITTTPASHGDATATTTATGDAAATAANNANDDVQILDQEKSATP